MKVRITGHSGNPNEAPWWYVFYIGEEFEVEPDEKLPHQYYTMFTIDGKLQKCHILKVDCEVIG